MINRDSDPPHIPENCGNCEFITDIHFQSDITHIWTMNRAGLVKHYPLFYHPTIYIVADADAQQYPVYPKNRTLHEIARDLQTLDDIASIKHVNRYTSSSSETYVNALKIQILSPKKMQAVVEFLKTQRYNLFNCDLNNRQQFFLDTESFPFGACHITLKSPSAQDLALLDYDFSSDIFELDKIVMYDDPNSIEFSLPPFKVMQMKLKIAKSGAFATPSDPLVSIEITTSLLESKEEKGVLNIVGSELEILQSLQKTVQDYDPDFLLIANGDRFTINYLATRAQHHYLDIYLGRLPILMFPRKKRKGQVYMSYGQIMNRDPVVYIPGRMHIDYENSFFLYESEIAGLISLSRLSATPAERVSRASIGTVLTGIEYLINTNTIPKTLIPPNKPIGELFKPSESLLIADNGGLIYPAMPGVYMNVWAIDFTSLYPMIMAKHNIGNESVLCPHEDCFDKNIVPELGYHICSKKIGVVPRTMAMILEKRVKLKYTKMLDLPRKEQYKGIDSALKWILVCCFEGSTRVLIRKNGVYLSERLDTIVNGFTDTDKLEALGMDERGQPEFKPVKGVIKVQPETPVFRVQFQGGKTAVATADHLWPVITRNGWQNVRTDQLTKDHWIPQLDQFDLVANYEELDIIEELASNVTDSEIASWRIQSEGLVDILHNNFGKIKNAALDEYSIQSINNWRVKGMIPLKYWSLIKSELTVSQLYIGSGKQSGGLIQWLNARIPLSQDLGFFLGFLLGDGSIGNTVRLAVGSEDHDLIEVLCKIISRVWNIEAKVYEEKSANMVNVQINSRALSYILKNVFGITGRAIKRTLSIPEVVWNGPIEIAQGFLSGLFAADGSVGTDRLFACFNTVQKSFAEEIGILCTRVGLAYRLYTEGEMCKVELRDDRYVVLLESFGFMCSKHKEKIELHRKNRQQVRYNEWPTVTSGLLDLAHKTRKTRDPRVTQKEAISKLVFAKKLKQIRDVSNKLSDAENQHLERLEVLAEAPMHFTRVVKVEQLKKSPDYVYCLELDSPTPWFMIQGSIITHNCFGYLGFKNSRWGSIESHQCVTAYGRRYLLQARMICKEFGFKIIAGITDSLFIQAEDPEFDNRETIDKLVYTISKETSIPMDLEGKFNWVVFCNVKEYPDVAALNRYFGYYSDEKLKIRGIRARQRSVTTLEDTFQREILALLAKQKTLSSFKSAIHESAKILDQWKKRLRSGDIDSRDLIFKIKSHVGSGNYKSRTQQAIAAQNYVDEGRAVEQGQSIYYLVREDKRRDSLRVTIGPRVEENSQFDVDWYCKVLDKAFLELLEAPQKQLFGKVRYGKSDSYEDLLDWLEIEN